MKNMGSTIKNCDQCPQLYRSDIGKLITMRHKLQSRWLENQHFQHELPFSKDVSIDFWLQQNENKS